MHVVYTMANNSWVPYFNWFAERSRQETGIRFTFIALHRERPKMLDDMAERGCDCYWIPFDDRKRKQGMMKVLLPLYRLFRQIHPDIVHTHLFDDSLPSLIAAWLAGVKVRFITKQDTGFHWNFAPAYVRFDRLNNYFATRIQAVADRNQQFILEKEQASPEKVCVVRNGFPPNPITASNNEMIAKLKEQYHLEGRFVVGTVARLIRWKGHHLIIEAASKLVREYPHLTFLWAGTGDINFQRQLEIEIRARGLESNIVIAGWVERCDMPSLYKCMDMYLHPAIEEPFGFAISEALMNRVPVAATRTGSTDLIIHKEQGWLLQENDVQAIIDAIKFYISDKCKRKDIAEAGQGHALEHLAFERMWKEQIAHYQKCLAGLL